MPKEFKRINQKKISVQVYEQIRAMIETGALEPDEKLKSERELSALLNVSRSSVREAILKLECAGLVEQRHGEGTYVLSAVEAGLNPVFEAFFKNSNSILDLMEIRSVLESWAAATAAERATEGQLEGLQKCLDNMKAAGYSGALGYEQNLNFHKLISLATHNILLVHVINTFSAWFQQLTSEIYTQMYTIPNMHDSLIEQHEAIVEAIQQRDKEKASTAMKQHLAYARQQLLHVNLGINTP
ncbi:FadR/GntR family transcriptional regulator [uncultured Desulfuromusa sp.]|uniref:FadR/GntR family transcriptional regulator n=1 Tax=uncultured Desulfuromusa sp. TaxID=219183 RepID=UPI002AA6BF45|nr:FadR/GntR family transcriptional regulator [uncultured Desulfuromusa sp.]